MPPATRGGFVAFAMNRRQRRAVHKKQEALRPRRAPAFVIQADIDSLFAAAVRHDRNGAVHEAEHACRRILASNPKHVPSIVLLASIAQSAGRNQAAMRLLRDALAADDCNPAAHDAIATAFQASGRRDDAVRHYTTAIACGLDDVEGLVKGAPIIGAALARLRNAWPRRLTLEELTGPGGFAAVAREALLIALLQSRPVRDVELERFLTALRHALLRRATAATAAAFSDDEIGFCCALARQCYINEYAFAVGSAEVEEAEHLRQQVMATMRSGADIDPLPLSVLACYVPLHSLTAPLDGRCSPASIDALITQQVREHQQEADDRDIIAAVTPIEDAVSLAVRRQYEENPYPRWTVATPTRPATIDGYIGRELPFAVMAPIRNARTLDILVAGCGTGKHPIELAQTFPDARLLAVDLSKASLAYARRKTREAGIGNIEYAQADILALPSIARSFDVIEAAGVLHHLADPFAGWRALLAMLRPNGLMGIGLYSETARRPLTALRAEIAARGLQPTTHDIRAFRQELISQFKAPQTEDFFCISGCRDLLFNVMEHRFTIAQIKSFIDDSGLRFLGFAVPAAVEAQFRQHHPDPSALVDLALWDAYESSHPHTFITMYKFWVQKANG